MLFIIVGKSSTGKDTIFNRLLLNRDLKLKKLVTYTTRPMRSGETEGMEYHFVDDDALKIIEQEGRLIEKRSYDTIHGVWSYFTVDGNDDIRKGNYLTIGTLQSLEKISAYYGSEYVFPIFITVDDGIRLQRALERERLQANPDYAEMCRRYLADMEDFKNDNLGKLNIKNIYTNDDIDKCVDNIAVDIKKIISVTSL